MFVFCLKSYTNVNKRNYFSFTKYFEKYKLISFVSLMVKFDCNNLLIKHLIKQF